MAGVDGLMHFVPDFVQAAQYAADAWAAVPADVVSKSFERVRGMAEIPDDL
jgi:hypothetical protein